MAMFPRMPGRRVVSLGYGLLAAAGIIAAGQTEDALAPRVEAARAKRDEVQLSGLKAEFEKRITAKDCDGRCYYEFARTESYLADAYDLRKDKKQAQKAVEQGIDAALHAAQMDDKSADLHALLADLYGHRISYGMGMFTGPKYGPKVKDEAAKAIALDEKNPRAWASDGRKFLLAPKMFGGDVVKAIESFKKSLELDGNQAETWSWLARAYKKQGDTAAAKDALRKAMQLEPQNPMVESVANDLS